MSTDHQFAYPPLDVPKPVAEGIWVVDGAPIRPGRLLALPVRMIAIRLASGDLWLHSPIRHSAGLAHSLAGLGPVRHLVAPNIAHWSFLPDWQKAHPAATLWGTPGLRARRQVRKSGLRIDHDLGDAPPEAWSGQIDQAVVLGAGGFREVAFLHRPSRTLLLTDLVANLEAARLPRATRLFARANGMLAPDGRAAAYVRLSVRMRKQEAARAIGRLLEHQPERLVFPHGAWFDRDGTAAARRSLDWLLG